MTDVDTRFRTAYAEFVRDDGISCGPSMTVEYFKDECDINNIMKKFEETGQLPNMIKENPQYGDFSDVPTYQEALHIVALAHEQFDALDAHVRKRFDNDPAKFLDFVNDPSNQEELVRLGLATKQDDVAVTTPDVVKTTSDKEI